MAFRLTSPAFKDGEAIPARYARDGGNLSPPLEWRQPPPGTRSFALLVEDPDAPSGVFRHWASHGIAAERTRLPEGTTVGANPESAGHAVNDFGNFRYDGPQPPKGHGKHHYRFRLAALDTEHLPLSARPSAVEMWQAAEPHILAEAELVGTCEKR